MTKGKRSRGLTIIAVGKLMKTTALVVSGVVILSMHGKSPPDVLIHVARVLRMDEDGRLVHHAIEAVSGIQRRQLEEVGVATFVYAALFGTEGVGLWLQKRWAEYFTIAITVSFIPIELYELVHRPTVPRAVLLVLNVAVLVYLGLRVSRGGGGGGDPRP